MENMILIEKNKDFVSDNAVEYLVQTYPAYDFDPEFLRRDVVMMLDIIAGELHLEGAMHPALNATEGLVENYWQLNKWKGSFRSLRKQNSITLDVMEYVGKLVEQVLKNEKVEDVKCDHYEQYIDSSVTVEEEKINRVPEIVSLIAANASAGAVRTPGIDFIEDYFDKGFVVTETPPDIHRRLWEEVERTNWVESEGNTYKKIPDWYVQKKRKYIDPTGADRQIVERWEGLYGYYHAPETLKQIAADLINDKMFEALRMWRPPNAVPKFIHFWNGSENSQHHVDSIDGSDVMIFCYATDAGEWQQDWGGYINLMKEVNNEFYYTRNVMPDDGRMVVVNNAAPIFKHGIRDLVNKDVNRYTFIFHYTWTYDEDSNYGIDNQTD